MKQINCSYCKKPIETKNDLLLGSHYFQGPSPYHKNCFDEAKKNQAFLKRPVMRIPAERFKFFVATNILNIVLGVLIIIFAEQIKNVYPVTLSYTIGFFLILAGAMFVKTFLKYKNLD